MRIFLAVVLNVAMILKYATINTFYYIFNQKKCLELNEKIYKDGAPRLFKILKQCCNFQVKEDKTLMHNLPEQYFVICNHQSLLDIVMFMTYLNTTKSRFFAKGALGKNVPLISKVLKTGGHCIINRKAGPAEMMHNLDAFSERVKKNNWIPVLFPEGTRSRDGNLLTFHSAGFRRVLNNHPMPVLTCAIDGGWKISTLFKLIKNLNNGELYIKALKLYPAPHTKEEQVAILDESKELIQKQLDEWRKNKDF